MSRTRGVVFIHSAPAAMCPHIEWAIGGVLGAPVDLPWEGQPVGRSTYRCEYEWRGPSGAAARIASTLAGWARLCFEVTEEPTLHTEGERYSFTPELGLFSAVTGPCGDIMVSENRLSAAMTEAAAGGLPLEDAVAALLGKPWDDALESYRYASEEEPARWLHAVV